MNWDAIGAIAEATAALGVVLSLVYVGRQIRQNSKIVVANAAKDVADTSREWFTYIIQDPALGKIFYEGAEDPNSLSEEDFLRFTTLMFTYFKHLESIHYQFEIGLLPEKLWKGWDHQTRRYIESPGIQMYWDLRKNSFSDSFQKYVETPSSNSEFQRAKQLVDARKTKHDA